MNGKQKPSILSINKLMMATLREKSQCVMWLHETKSPKTVQRRFLTNFGRPSPDVKTIKNWYSKFMDTGSVKDRPRTGRTRVTDASVEEVRQTVDTSPRKSTRAISTDIGIPKSTVHKILRKQLSLFPYKLQIHQALHPGDRELRFAFGQEMEERIVGDTDFLQRICFSDESTFHTSGKVNRHNVRIWGSEPPNNMIERERDSPKVNVWCGLMHNKVIGPFFFAEKTITASIYLDMLELYACPQLRRYQPWVIFQQDGAPPHWGLTVREFLSHTFPDRWIGRDGPISWPPRSPDITPLDFFLWGYIKDYVYSAPTPDVQTLTFRIQNAVESITPEMLENTWKELAKRVTLLVDRHGNHTETK